MVFPPDYHLHTEYCGHAKGTVEDMVTAAISKGFTEIGFSEHHPYPDFFSTDVADAVVPANRWQNFIDDVFEVAQKYKDSIQVRLGTEIDYLPGTESAYRELLDCVSFEYIFGSVHILDGIFVDYDSKYLNERKESLGGDAGIWQRYWDALEKLIESDLCDIISHIDLPKKFGLGYPDLIDWDRIDDILKKINEKDKTIEINTGGIDRSFLKEAYPGEKILRRAYEMNLDILVGSDAHHPDQIGRHFKQALSQLESIGWKYITVFANRKKSYIPLSDFI